MERKLLAMIAHDDTETRALVHAVLRDEGLEAECVTSCDEARALLAASRPPEVIFIGASLGDCNWRDVLRMARNADSRAEVIVITRLNDMQAYFEATAEGKVDYIVPPLRAPRGRSYRAICSQGPGEPKEQQRRPAGAVQRGAEEGAQHDTPRGFSTSEEHG